MKVAAIALAIVMMGQTTAVQYFKTGATILKEAGQWEKFSRGEDPDDLSAVSYFQGYVAGTLDAEGRPMRTPEGFTVDQACGIVAKFLRDNPPRLHEPAADLIKDALRKAYPAGGGSRSGRE